MESMFRCAGCKKTVSFSQARWLSLVGSVCEVCFYELPFEETTCRGCGGIFEMKDTHGNEVDDRICRKCEEKRLKIEAIINRKKGEQEDIEFIKRIETDLKGKTCPKCKSEKVAFIFWGLLMVSRGLRQMINQKKVVLGGCMISSEDMYCFKCKNNYQSGNKLFGLW